MKNQIVKVQIPLDREKARTLGQNWADENNPHVLIYDKARKHVTEGIKPEVRKYMMEYDNGPDHPKGNMKLFFLADWDGRKKLWLVDLAHGPVEGPTW